jgi:hypothetical protein
MKKLKKNSSSLEQVVAAEPDEEQIDSRAKALDEGKFEHIEEPYQYKEPLTYEQKL